MICTFAGMTSLTSYSNFVEGSFSMKSIKRWKKAKRKKASRPILKINHVVLQFKNYNSLKSDLFLNFILIRAQVLCFKVQGVQGPGFARFSFSWGKVLRRSCQKINAMFKRKISNIINKVT